MGEGGRDEADRVEGEGVVVELVVEGSGAEDEGREDGRERGACPVGVRVRNGVLAGGEGLCGGGLLRGRGGHVMCE